MTDRILDLSEEPARLNVKHDLLVIERESNDPVQIPLVDIAAMVVSHPQVRYTQAVLAGIAAAGGMFVVCDTKHMPAAMLMPIANHHLQTERFGKQAGASLPVRKQVWRDIIKQKIRAQSKLLEDLYGDDRGLAALVPKVKSGDPSNVEAQASRRYWPALFADKQFRRDPDGGDANTHLNYGYAVLRAIVARAVCAAGLHPSLGIHHHNRYNTFCLADDLMEPLRPLVDGVVVRRVREKGLSFPLDKESKAALISALTGRVVIQGEERTLFDAMARTAVSLAEVFEGKRRKIEIPQLL